jgi:predicted RNA-binding protein
MSWTASLQREVCQHRGNVGLADQEEVNMCLAKAYLNKSDDNPILQDVARMRLHDDQVELETLFGEERVISGRVVEIDFSTSKIVLSESTKANKA